MSLYLAVQEVELLGLLNEHRVRYIVIGGHAVSFHGEPRAMKDLDIWIEPTAENASRVARAVAGLRFHLSPEHIERLSKPNVQFPLSPLYMELLTSCGDLNFGAALSRAIATIEQGVPCRVLGLHDLVHSKRKLGREHDLTDVAMLEKTHDSQDTRS